jgi:hypothetical protein
MMTMTRKKGIKRETVTKTQRRAIKTYVKRGYSANKIQKQLQKRHIGIRRKTLLKEIHKIRRVKAHRRKYIPRNYYYPPTIPRRKARKISVGLRRIILTGWHRGKRVEKKRFGSGRELRMFVIEELGGGYWDARPKITS